MNDNSLMNDKSIGRLLWQFSWPTIVGMLCSALYNIVDRIFVGRGVGSLAIAATTVAFPIMMTFMALSMLIGVGATALISIRLGEQKKEKAEMVAANAITLLVVVPLIFIVLYFLFPDPILRLFGADSEVLPYARDFMHIYMLGAVFGSLSMGANNFIRAEGNPVMAMSTQVLGALLNGVLNYLFIFKLGLGIKGSALATVCGMLFSSIWVFSYYLSGRSLIKIRTKNLWPRFPVFISIISIGFAPCAMELANCVQQVILNKTVLAYSGNLALSTVGILMSVVTLLFLPILGISQGAQPLIGFNYGARQYDLVKAILKKAVISASCVSIAVYLAILIWPAEIAGLFSKGDAALTTMASKAMVVYFSLIFVIGFQVVCSGYFQSVGRAAYAALLGLSRQVLLFIPLLLILPHFWGIDGVWRAAPISDGLSTLITAVFIILEIKYLPATDPLLQMGREAG